MNWPEDKLRDEVAWGRRALDDAGIEQIAGFASPGWTSPPALASILADFQFKFLCDGYGCERGTIVHNPMCGDIVDAPTNVAGAHGVGYLEYCAATQEDEQSLRQRFRLDLEWCGQLAVMYDHPCFAGGAGLPLLCEFLDVAQELEFSIRPIRDVVASVCDD